MSVSTSRDTMTEAIGILYRIHVYLYAQWIELGYDGEGVRLAMKVIVDARYDLILERDELDARLQIGGA